MPGLTIIAGPNAVTSDAVAVLRTVARDSEVVESLFEAPGKLQVAWVSQARYPRRIVRTSRGFAVVEGTLLWATPEAAETELRAIIEALHRSDRAGQEAARNWAAHADGDFVLVVAAHGSDSVLIANDALGRLPVYVRERHGNVTISRQIKALVALGGAGDSDTLAIAQILLFGFALGRRTLIRDIRMLPPATVVTISGSECALRTSAYNQWNFEDGYAAHSRDVVRELADCFIATCAEQAAQPGFTASMLQLSGGLDSRAVAAGLTASEVPFSTTTFRTSDGAYDPDVALAREIASALHRPWHLYRLQDPNWDGMVATTMLCDGLNYSGMASRLEYLEAIRCDFGPGVACFTGDGGDKAFPDLRAPWWASTPERYLDYRLEDSVFPLRVVASLLALEEGEIRDDIRDYFHGYPERHARMWEVRFLVMERGWGWLVQGEERNRAFAWHQTPFYGRRFFEQVMRVHPDLKHNYRLYRDFLKTLAPQLLAIPNAKWEAPLGSPKALLHEMKPWLRSQVPSPVRRPLRSLRSRIKHQAVRAFHVDEEIRTAVKVLLCDEAVAQIFDTRVVADVLAACNETQFHYLATQLIYVSQTWGLKEKQRVLHG